MACARRQRSMGPPLLLLLLLLGGASRAHGRSWESAAAAAVVAGHRAEAFVGWRGESYLAPPASPAAASGAAEPQDWEVPHAAGSATAHVEQLQDIAAAGGSAQAPQHEHSYDNGQAAAAAAGPPAPAQQHMIDVSRGPGGAAAAADRVWVQHLSWHPRLHLAHSFLSAAECDRMRNLLARPSRTVGGSSSEAASSPEEEEASLQLMLAVERRVANWTHLPSTHLEGWQLQHGFTGADRSLHTDLLTERFATEDYQRFRSATVMLFLGDGDAQPRAGRSGSSGSGSGSEWSIVFPVARGGAWRGSATPDEYPSIRQQGQEVAERLKSSRVGRRGAANEVLQLHIHTHEELGQSSSDGQGFCDGSVQAGLTLKGFKKGDALLIWNYLIEGQTPDASAAHLFCSNGAGKASQPWIATTWMHNLPYGQDSAMALAAVCQDNNPACRTWAQLGYCDDAPGAMLGLRGLCRYSCQDCRSCEHLQPRRAAFGSPDAAAPDRPSAKEYMECLYSNMHSLRQEWSAASREAGVRRARNAIRRDMRAQAERGVLSTASVPSMQQSAWIHRR